MRVRRQEVVWLLVLGGLLLAVRGLDARTANLRRSARAAATAGGLTGGGPSVAIAPTAPSVSTPAAGTAGAAGGETITAAELATLGWGANPFASAGQARVARDAGSFAGATERAEAPAASQAPVFRGLVSIRGKTLAALDDAFCAPGERLGDWLVQEIVVGGVTVRNVRTGEVRRLSRERTASAP